MKQPTMDFETWRQEMTRLLCERLEMTPAEWDETGYDWQATREMFYEEGFTAASAADEELYAMANS